MTSPREDPETNNLVVVIETRIGEQTLNSFWKIHHVRSFPSLDREMLQTKQPGTIICPLIFGPHDAIDVGKLISLLPKRPRLLVKPPYLPRPFMVLSELRAACPLLHIEFLADQLGKASFP